MRKRILFAGLLLMVFLLPGCGNTENNSVKTAAGQAEIQAEDAKITSENSSALQKEQTESEILKDSPELKAIKEHGKLKVGCRMDVKGLGMENPETKELEGLEIELAYAAAAKIFEVDLETAKEQRLCEFMEVTASTGFSLLEKGELDLLMAACEETGERKESCSFSKIYLEDTLEMMCLNNFGIQDAKDFTKAWIGVEQGSGAEEKIQNYLKENNLTGEVEFLEFDSSQALAAALRAGNIDIFAGGGEILKSYCEEDMMILPDRAAKLEYKAVTSLEATSLAKIVDQVINATIF